MSPLSVIGGPLIGPESLSPQSRGMEYIGGAKTDAGGVTSLAVTGLPPRDAFYVFGVVTGLSTADVLSMRFGPTTAGGATLDTGNTYWHRNMQAMGTEATAIANVSGHSGIGAHHTPNQLNIGYKYSGGLSPVDDGTTNARSFYMTGSNRLATTKTAFWQVARAQASVSPVAGVFAMGFGEWVNTVTQITMMTLSTNGGTATFNAGSYFRVHGSDFP